MRSLRIAVAGGGLGGLALAQGLRPAEPAPETGARRNRLLFWLYRRLARGSAG